MQVNSWGKFLHSSITFAIGRILNMTLKYQTVITDYDYDKHLIKLMHGIKHCMDGPASIVYSINFNILYESTEYRYFKYDKQISA